MYTRDMLDLETRLWEGIHVHYYLVACKIGLIFAGYSKKCVFFNENIDLQSIET